MTNESTETQETFWSDEEMNPQNYWAEDAEDAEAAEEDAGTEEVTEEEEQEEAEADVEAEETEEEEDAEVAEDDTEEDVSDEEVEEDKDEESGKDYKTISSNLTKALQIERDRRKELAETNQSMMNQVQNATTEAEGYKAAYEALIESAKEVGVDEYLEINEVKGLSEEDKKAQAAQQEEANQKAINSFYAEVRDEATSRAPEFTNIDLEDASHQETLTKLVTYEGMRVASVEEAVENAMKTMNTLMGATVVKKRQPTVAVKKKIRSTGKKPPVGNSFREKVKKGAQTGNFDDALSAVVDRMLTPK